MAESRLGSYRDLARIAVGGTAEVFRARDERTGELVALKVLLPHTDGGLRDQALREASLQECLRHPNLVAVREHGVVDGHAFLALELVEGPSLATVLAQRRLTPATAVHIGVGVLEALAAVHGARDAFGRPLGIVHRDVTPQNIMLNAQGQVKLGDFGIAFRRGGARTRTGMIKGKLGYLAPEQVTQSSVDARTDIFQAGLVLFEMLCGAPYFDGMSELELLRAAEAPVTKRPSTYGAPPIFDAVVLRALQRFPEERYASADAFARDLASLAPGLGPPDLTFAADAVGARPTLVPGAPPQLRRRSWIRPGLLVVAFASVVAAAGWFVIRGPAEADPLRVSPPPAAEPLASSPPEPQPLTPLATPAPAGDYSRAEATRALPSKKSRGALADVTKVPPQAVPSVPDPSPPAPPAESLQGCVERLAKRGFAVVDLAPDLQRELVRARAAAREGGASDPQALCARLDAVVVDRALVERKLTRIQAQIDALVVDDPRRPGLARLTRDTLQTFLDGNIARTNDKLRELDTLLAR